MASGGDVRREEFIGNGINYTPAPEDEFMSCPYYNHVIRKATFSKHVSRCRKRAEKGQQLEMAICCWNYCHHFPKLEIQYHEDTCPDAGQMVDHLIKLEDPKGFTYNVIDNNVTEDQKLQLDAGAKVDWDEDVRSGHGGSYDPQVKLDKDPGIIQNPPAGASKSEREEFRKGQDQKFRDEGGDFNDDPIETTDTENKIKKPRLE